MRYFTLAVGLSMTIVGWLGVLIVTPYAFIIYMMSGFSEDQARLQTACIAIPIGGVIMGLTGVLILIFSPKARDPKPRKAPNHTLEATSMSVTDAAAQPPRQPSSRLT